MILRRLLVAVAAAVLSSLVAIQIKQLSRVDAADTIVFYTYVFWVPISLVPALFAWQWPQGIQWLWLLLLGAFGTGGQLLWTRALKIGEVSALQPISFVQLPLVALAAWLLPLLLHLARRDATRPTPFAALRFLREKPRPRRRRANPPPDPVA